jgi:hypothetical protein
VVNQEREIKGLEAELDAKTQELARLERLLRDKRAEPIPTVA